MASQKDPIQISPAENQLTETLSIKRPATNEAASMITVEMIHRRIVGSGENACNPLRRM